MISVIMLSVTFFYYYAKCHYVECHYAECRYAEYRSGKIRHGSSVLKLFKVKHTLQIFELS
jgi:hypothetical protein